MKKLIIAVAVLGAFTGAAQAQSNVTIYGLLDSFVEVGHNGQNSVTRVHSGGTGPSRIGFRGTEDLGGGLKAVFTLETGVNVDDGSAAQGGILFGRTAMVGLTGDFGTVSMGRQYTPLFMTHVLYTMGGGTAVGMGWGNAANYFLDGSIARATNSVQYVSPSMSGFVAKVMLSRGENPAPGLGKLGNTYGFSGQYNNGPLSLNLSHMNRTVTLANSEKMSALGASYDFKVLKAGLLYQVRRDDANLAQNNYFDISASVPVAGGALLLDFGGLSNKVVADAGARTASIRYDHFLSKRTIIYTGLSTVRNDTKARYGVAASAGVPMAVAAGNNSRAFAAGVRHTF